MAPAAVAVAACLAWGPALAQGGGGKVLARWLFDEGSGTVASDGVDGAENGKIENAVWAEGKSGKALQFEDYSLLNYLKPDVAQATRVVAPHGDRVNPSGPFTLRAVVYPTRDPVYYGGIFEKGRGYGATLRLVIRRGLKLRAVYGPGGATVDASSPLALDAWHEVVVKFDGSNLTLEVDGKLQGSKKGVKAGAPSSDPVVIGERFSGKIDEVVLTSP